MIGSKLTSRYGFHTSASSVFGKLTVSGGLTDSFNSTGSSGKVLGLRSGSIAWVDPSDVVASASYATSASYARYADTASFLHVDATNYLLGFSAKGDASVTAQVSTPTTSNALSLTDYNDGGYNATTGFYTIPVSGYYQINMYALSNGAYDTHTVGKYDSAGTYIEDIIAVESGNDVNTSGGSAVEYLVAGQKIRANFKDAYRYRCRFSAYLLNYSTAGYAKSASLARSSSYAKSASYARSSSMAISSSYAISASYSKYALRAGYAKSASYADGVYVNFLSSGSSIAPQSSMDIWEAEMIRLNNTNTVTPGTLVAGGSARSSYRVYWLASDNTYPANINQNYYGISKYGTIKVGANAQGALPLGNEDNANPYINGGFDVAGTGGPNKPTPYGLGRNATIRDIINSNGEFSLLHWGGDDGEGARYEVRFSDGNKLRLIPAYSANNAQAYNEVYQTNQNVVATNVLNYATTRPWGYWSGRLNQIFQWKVVRNGANLESSFRCNGSQNWILLRTIAATTFTGMWNADATVNNWWMWQYSKGFAWSATPNALDATYVKMSQSEFPMNM
jgi:hypothetical protein